MSPLTLSPVDRANLHLYPNSTMRLSATCRTLAFALLCGLASASLSAQTTTLANFTFESDSQGTTPAGWTSSSSSFKATSNNYQGGINSSNGVAYWSAFNSADAALIDLTGYTTGHTFTLSFDLLVTSSTNNHGVLIGYGHQASSSDTWIIGPSYPSNWTSVGNPPRDDVAAINVWQHFSFDYTSAISKYMTDNPVGAGNFYLFADQWGQQSPTGTSYIDNIQLTATAVPEPSTYAILAGLAVLGFAFWRRQRRRRA